MGSQIMKQTLIIILLLSVISCENSTEPIDVTIVNQNWSKRNLDVITFRNGDTILRANSLNEWNAAYDSERPAYCYYKFDSAYGVKYGKLYNYFAISDSRNIAPLGYRKPTKSDWNRLIYNIVGDSVNGYQTIGTHLYIDSVWNSGGNDKGSSAFNLQPSGYYDPKLGFKGLDPSYRFASRWWVDDNGYLLIYSLDANASYNNIITILDRVPKGGYSIRCIKEQQ
jgi:uncharacterized protein (TIGR02145 family)